MAQLRVYFKREIKDRAKFETEEVNEKHGNVYKRHTFKGIRVESSKGVWYSEEFSLGDFIPPRIRRHIISASLHAYPSVPPQREAGIYRDGRSFGDAVGELTVNSGNSYYLKIRAKDPKNVAKLYYAIRNGSVRPKESWESVQSGKSRQELEAESRKIHQRLSGRWPWCRKAVLREIVKETS